MDTCLSRTWPSLQSCWPGCCAACPARGRKCGAWLARCCGAGTAWTWAHGRVLTPREVKCSVPLALLPGLQTFVALAAQRTGTRLLCGLLHGATGVSMHNELFNDKGVCTHRGGISKDVPERGAAPERFLLQAFSVADEGAMGFKLVPEHIRKMAEHEALLKHMLADLRARKIVLRRENQAAVAALRLRAATAGACTHTLLPNVRIVIPVAGLQDAPSTYETYYAVLNKAMACQHVLQTQRQSWHGCAPTLALRRRRGYPDTSSFGRPGEACQRAWSTGTS